MTTWFCDAYASWQKGGVENANALITPLVASPDRHRDQVSDEEIQDIVITGLCEPDLHVFAKLFEDRGPKTRDRRCQTGREKKRKQTLESVH